MLGRRLFSEKKELPGFLLRYGILITDTAPFRYPHYHERSGTPDKLDYERMAQVVTGIGRVVEGLAK